MGLNCRNRICISVKKSFWLSCAVGVLLLPFKWFIAWLIAAGVHELCHFVALKIFGIRIYGIIVGAFGAQLITEPLDAKTECICALAGPLGGCLLICLYRHIPTVAFFALIQTIFNILPINQRDGARVLRCIMVKRLGFARASRVCTFVEHITKLAGVALCVLLTIYLRFLLPVILLLFVMIRKTPCKPRQQIVQ